MPPRHVVVDGSNIATEGRTLPSLQQLNDAVLAFCHEYPDAEITVVVDASFAHRIDPSELAEYEAAEANNELVSPPAGAIGRGDAFLLRIAGKIGATVLSNDSFQEFHGDHDWLFTEGRLIGGKPVPGVGWIFTPRTPVRGIKSRKAVKDAKGRVKADPLASGEELGPMPVPAKPPPRRKAKADKVAPSTKEKDRVPAKDKEKEKAPAKDKDKVDRAVLRAIAVATGESIETAKPGRKRRRKKRGGGQPAEPVNEPLAFITFIANHKLGAPVDGVVESFTSHGAFVVADGARCYIPIVALGDPPPRAARDVLRRGEGRTFVVQALDPQRRGIELALPEFARVAGAPTEETIEAEIAETVEAVPVSGSRRKAGARRPAPAPAVNKVTAPAKRAAAKKVAASAKKAAGSAKKVVGSTKKATPKKATSKKAAPEKATSKKATPKKVAPKKAAPKKAAPNKAAPKKAAPKKAAPTKAAPNKATSSAKKVTTKTAGVAAKAGAGGKKAGPGSRNVGGSAEPKARAVKTGASAPKAKPSKASPARSAAPLDPSAPAS